MQSIAMELYHSHGVKKIKRLVGWANKNKRTHENEKLKDCLNSVELLMFFFLHRGSLAHSDHLDRFVVFLLFVLCLYNFT